MNFEVLKLHLCMDIMKFALNVKAQKFSRFPGDKFLNFILFFQKIGFSALLDLENFSPDSIRVNFEVLKLFIYAWIFIKL